MYLICHSVLNVHVSIKTLKTVDTISPYLCHLFLCAPPVYLRERFFVDMFLDPDEEFSVYVLLDAKDATDNHHQHQTQLHHGRV